MVRRQKRQRRSRTTKHYLRHREKARALLEQLVWQYNLLYKHEIGRVSIKNQKTRWGSCSDKRNLNFNYKVMFLPQHLASYIVVHELCHLQELNHSARFWNLVAQTFPNYKQMRQELRRHSDSLS